MTVPLLISVKWSTTSTLTLFKKGIGKKRIKDSYLSCIKSTQMGGK